MSEPVAFLLSLIRQYRTQEPSQSVLARLLGELGAALPLLGGGLVTDLVFRPGAVSAGNVYGTWPEVVTASDAAAGAVRIFFDNALAACVISSSLNGQGRAVLLPGNQAGNGIEVRVADGAVLTDIAALENNIILTLDAVTVSPIVFTPAPIPPESLPNRTFLMNNGAVLTLNPGALVPGCVIPAGMALILEMELASFLDNSSVPGVPVIELAASGASLILTAIAQIGLNGPEVGGAAGTFFQYNHDASCPSSLVLGNFTGTFQGVLIDTADQVGYAPALPGSYVAPPPSTVAAALDRLTAAVVALRGSPIP